MQRCLILAVALALAVGAVNAHHPFSPTYDAAKPGTITGQVVAVQWANPHVIVALDVVSGGRTERWVIEGLPPSPLQREGWTRETLRQGMRISISGWHARDASRRIFFGREVTFEDGSKRVFGQTPEGADKWNCSGGDCPSAIWIPTFAQ